MFATSNAARCRFPITTHSTLIRPRGLRPLFAR
jgi:hypothetical protein